MDTLLEICERIKHAPLLTLLLKELIKYNVWMDGPITRMYIDWWTVAATTEWIDIYDNLLLDMSTYQQGLYCI
jgi:hypothetical protein